MKRIVIYVHNEEMAALKPLAARLMKKGALVTFSALKFREAQKADQVLTYPRYLETVKAIFDGTDVPVVAIEDVETDEPAAPIVVAEEPTIPVLVVPEPEVVVDVVDAELPDVPAATDEVVIISVGDPEAEDEAPVSPRVARARKNS